MWCKFCLDESLRLISPTIRLLTHHDCLILKTYFKMTNWFMSDSHPQGTILEMFACCQTFFMGVCTYRIFLLLFIEHKGLWNYSTNLSISLSLQFRFDFPALLPTVGVCSRWSFLRLWQRPSVFIQASLPFDSSTHEQARTFWRL